MKEWEARWKSIRTRGELKNIATEIDGNEAQKQWLLQQLLCQEYDVSMDMPSKKLLRLWLDRSEKAQERKNPIHRNESFDCVYCHQHVPVAQSKIRDHCPFCLRAIHIDVVPGDRAATCLALLVPVALDKQGDQVWISYKCSACPHEYRVRSHPEDRIPLSLSIADLPQIP